MEIIEFNLKDIKCLSGIYLLFDKNLELIYVGQTSSLKNRLWQHTSENNSSTLEKINTTHGNTSIILRGLVKFYSFIKCENKIEKDLIESFCIYYLKPKLQNA